MPARSIIPHLWAVVLTLSVPQISPAADDPFARALDERMPALLAKYQVPGAVISCITNGDVAWTKAFGLANLKTGAPMRSDMVFNHGSNGKVLTMWGIMRLVEQGRVELDAPANRYLKRWQIRSSQFDPAGVTIRRMLSHTAGLSVHGFLDYDQRRGHDGLALAFHGGDVGAGDDASAVRLPERDAGPGLVHHQPEQAFVVSFEGQVSFHLLQASEQ